MASNNSYGDEFDLTEEFAAEFNPPSTSEKSAPTEIEVFPLTVIEPQPVSVIEKIKSLGNEAVYVLQDLLLDPAVSDRVRLDAVKAVIAIVEAEKNKELVAVETQSADLDELERIIRDNGFNL